MFETVRHDMPREKANSHEQPAGIYSAGWFWLLGIVDHEKRVIHMGNLLRYR
ncbi:MAG: hypothetical protein ACLUR4_10115 [Blautia massiliensis (ex Durand et al. 2017)]|uniref:hypothetical protein n=1 Tax=Blautia massiliensis (ex Durand et al. 2017) TaxID=1737424 RepID=UPI0039923A52